MNLAFAVIILLIFGYSLAFPHLQHPIPSLFTEITGIVPPSKGLSSSFSEILRGNIESAISHNSFGIRIFAFFGIQMLLRVFFSMVVRLKSDKILAIAITDIAITFLFFIWSFAPLIVYTLRLFSGLIENILKL